MVVPFHPARTAHPFGTPLSTPQRINKEETSRIDGVLLNRSFIVMASPFCAVIYCSVMISLTTAITYTPPSPPGHIHLSLVLVQWIGLGTSAELSCHKNVCWRGRI
jgi:hypothetical protein